MTQETEDFVKAAEAVIKLLPLIIAPLSPEAGVVAGPVSEGLVKLIEYVVGKTDNKALQDEVIAQWSHEANKE